MFIARRLSTLEGLRRQLNSAHGPFPISKRYRTMRSSKFAGGKKLGSYREKFITNIKFSMMADNDVSAVILPTTAYILKLVPPPARKMIDSGVVVALGSDYNPNGM